MNLPLFIARRYLFAKKSHNVINVISAISAVGMAVGTAALIVILSIYNGFDALVKSMLSSVEPDLMIVPSKGKFFTPEGPAYDWMYENPDISSVCTVLQDNVFFSYDSYQGTAMCKGVDIVYEEESPLIEYVTEGEWRLRMEERRYAAVGSGLARTAGMNVNFVSGISLYYPNGGTVISPLNPMGALNSEKVWPSCEFSVNADVDSRLMIVSRDVMCSLTGCSDEVSAVEVRLAEGLGQRDCRRIARELSSLLGDGFRVQDRSAQNPQLYKMLRYEKLSVYLILLFVVLILGFSIFGSLSMLIIDKTADIETLRAMGAGHGVIRSIFTLEGWMITLLGMFSGAVIGVLFCLAQQKWGFIKMPGNYLVDAYPVILQPADVLICVVSIAALGYLIALIASRRL